MGAVAGGEAVERGVRALTETGEGQGDAEDRGDGTHEYKGTANKPDRW